MDSTNGRNQFDEARSHGPIGWPVVISILISTAISAAATGLSLLLNRPKNPRSPFDSTPTPLSQRGTMIPNLYGRRRIGFCFGWAGNRRSTSHKGVRTYYESGWHILCIGPCNALHGIYENGKPIFTQGLTPVSTPSGTTVDVTNHGKFRIFWGQCDQNVNHDFNKTGVNKDGSPAYPGVDSRWPGICYIEWINKKLGYQPQWPRLEYEIERRGESDTPTLTSAPNWTQMTTLPNKVNGTTVYTVGSVPSGTYTVTFTAGACKWGPVVGWSIQNPALAKYGFYVVNQKGTRVLKLPGSTKQYTSQASCAAANAGKTATFHWPGGKIGVSMADGSYKNNFAGTPNPTWTFDDGTNPPFSLEAVVQTGITLYGSADSGMNPAHVMWQILTGAHPYGMGIPIDALDSDSFEAVAAACDAERLVMNLGGDPAVDAITNLTDVMADAGILLTQVGDKLRAVVVRPDVIPRATVPLDANASAVPSITRAHSNFTPDRTGFYFRDRTRNYRASENLGPGGHDALAVRNHRPKTTQVELKTVTDRTTAAKVAGRRGLDIAAEVTAVEFSALRNAGDLYPGQPIGVEGWGDYRVATITPNVLEPYVAISAVLDHYGRGADDSSAVGDYDEGFGFDGPDAFVAAIQAPTGLAPTADPYTIVLRIREDVDVLNAAVLISADDTNYIDIGDVPFCAGGTLNSSIPSGTALVDAEGPTITAVGPDFLDLVEDLTGRDREYDAGRQLALIGTEWFLLRKVTAVSGGYRLDGLTRAQFGSVAADHDDNAPVFIVRRENVSMFRHVLMGVGETAYFKVQPNDASGFPAIELDGLEPVAVAFV